MRGRRRGNPLSSTVGRLLILTQVFARRDTARLIIRKIQYAPSQVGAGPKVDLCKSFMMSDKPVHVEACMDKDVQSLFFICLRSVNIFIRGSGIDVGGGFLVSAALLPRRGHPHPHKDQQ